MSTAHPLAEGFVVTGADLGDAHLGYGSFKKVWPLRAEPERYVVGVWHNEEDFNKLVVEQQTLEEIAKLELPVVSILAKGSCRFGPDERPRPAQLMQRYAVGSDARDNDYMPFLSERTVESAERILERLDAHNVYIQDLQFLLDESGAIILSDPQGVKPKSELETWQHCDNTHRITWFRDCAKYKTALCAGRIGEPRYADGGLPCLSEQVQAFRAGKEVVDRPVFKW